ncbi:MAG: Uma2 family endonuclease [Chloroflexota bacterium]|nr:Uma2 family endonuclease [Chloroflexota bacterium]
MVDVTAPAFKTQIHTQRQKQRRSRPIPRQLSKLDRYEYGWREITRITENGDVAYERQPLTLWDILHPQVGDFRVHTDEHERFCAYLLNVFLAQVAGIEGAVVLHDTRVAWATPGVDAHGPDIAVIFDVRERDNWATFDEREEATRPTLIVEIVSPKTRRVDVIEKVTEYAQAGVAYYIIVDAHTRRGHTQYSLLGYQLVQGQYEPLARNEGGWLWLEPVQVWLGLRNNWLVCYDTNGNAIGDYVEVTQARRVAEQRAEQAEERATQEQLARIALEERLQAMEAEVRRLRGETR